MRPEKSPTKKLLLLAITGMAATLASCATAPAKAPQLWTGQMAQGLPTVNIPVRSWKARKFENVVRQQADFSCGAAVMATVFKYGFGYDTTEKQVLVNMLKIADPDLVREKGFSLLDMKSYAQTLGMEAEGYEVDYEQLTKLEVPMIVLLDTRGYKHFVVVRVAYDDKIAIADPALGNRMLTRTAFLDSWNSVVFIVLDERFDPEAELFQPFSPISAKRLLATHADIPAATAAEFGINTGFDFSL